MKFTLKTQLWMLCGGFLVILLLVAIISNFSSSHLTTQFDNVANVQLPAVRNMTLADMMHDGLRSVVLASLVAAESKDEQGLKEAIEEAKAKAADFTAYLENLERLPLNQDTRAAILETKPRMNTYIEQTNKIVQSASNEGYESAKTLLPEFDKSFKDLEGRMETLGELIEKDAAKAHASGGIYTTLNIVISIIGVLFCLVFGSFITIGLIKTMNAFSQKIHHAGSSLETASFQLSSASQVLATGASESAASLEETVASLEELSSMVRLNSENAAKASELSNQSVEQSRLGSDAIKKLTTSMGEIQESSKKMEEIIKVIDDIAFQTNLLALNASVEAARAGEMGKGFAVVAEAVRSLAARSAESAKDISKMIQDSVTRTQEGGQAAEQSAALIEKFFESAKAVSELNNQISEASKEQAMGISQINQAMNKVDQSSQSNAQVAQEVAQNSEEMSGLSKRMNEIVEDLNQLISGQRNQT
ncbi:methyl-accepting chemotaxis protein [Bdellovibrio bacteriovorus]